MCKINGMTFRAPPCISQPKRLLSSPDPTKAKRACAGRNNEEIKKSFPFRNEESDR